MEAAQATLLDRVAWRVKKKLLQLGRAFYGPHATLTSVLRFTQIPFLLQMAMAGHPLQLGFNWITSKCGSVYSVPSHGRL